MRAKGIGMLGWSPMALRGARIERPAGGGRLRAAPALALALAVSLTFSLWAGILAGSPAALAETRIRIREHRVVVSVLPLHSLVSGVMAGLGERALGGGHLIANFWIGFGPQLEEPLIVLNRRVRVAARLLQLGQALKDERQMQLALDLPPLGQHAWIQRRLQMGDRRVDLTNPFKGEPIE